MSLGAEARVDVDYIGKRPVEWHGPIYLCSPVILISQASIAAISSRSRWISSASR